MCVSNEQGIALSEVRSKCLHFGALLVMVVGRMPDSCKKRRFLQPALISLGFGLFIYYYN